MRGAARPWAGGYLSCLNEHCWEPGGLSSSPDFGVGCCGTLSLSIGPFFTSQCNMGWGDAVVPQMAAC